MGRTKKSKEPAPPDRIDFGDLSEQQKASLDKHRPTFVNRIGTKGRTEDSAADFVRGTVMPEFFAEYYPSSTKKQRESTIAHEPDYLKIYNYLNNGRRGNSGKKSKGPKIDVTNVWAEANPEVVNKLLADYRKDNGMGANVTISVDKRRTVVCTAFNALPDDEKRKWEERAQELRAEASKSKVLQGQARIDYARRFPSVLSQLIREAEEKAGIHFVGNIAYQIDDVGTLEVTSLASEKVKEYKNTDGHADSVSYWAEWLRGKGKSVKRDKPIELPYPDEQHENMPLIPKFDDDNPPNLPVLRKIVRVACSAMYQRLGGGVSVPWQEISRAHARGEYTYVEKARMPEGFPLIDPSGMDREYALVWVRWVRRRQDGIGNESNWFAYKTVFTTSINSKPVRQDAVSKRRVMRGSVEVWELVYDGWVRTCQVNGNIKYPDEAKEYQEYLARQLGGTGRSSRPHLLGLPCKNGYVPAPALTDSELEFILGLLGNIPDSEKETVSSLINSLNTMYALLPAETKDGIWSEEDNSLSKVAGHPALLPQSSSNLPTSREYLSSWIPSEYFINSFDAPRLSTIAQFEHWQKQALQKGFARHAESDTLLGGRNGTSFIVLSLLKVLLNIGAATGKLQLPSQGPPDLDDCRLTNADWARCLGWIRTCQELIEQTIKVLKLTFKERSGCEPLGSALQPGTPRSWTPEPSEPRSEPPEAGPSRPTRTRPAERFYSESDLPEDDGLNRQDEDARSFTDSEREHSDTYKPTEKPGSDSSVTDDPDPDTDADPISTRKKGKKVASRATRIRPTSARKNFDPSDDEVEPIWMRNMGGKAAQDMSSQSTPAPDDFNPSEDGANPISIHKKGEEGVQDENRMQLTPPGDGFDLSDDDAPPISVHEKGGEATQDEARIKSTPTHDESDPPEEDATPGSMRKKGKNVALGKPRFPSTPGFGLLDSERRKFEAEQGVPTSTVSKGPIEDVVLESHPLGVLVKPNLAAPWSGTPADLLKKCCVVKREAKDALKAIFSSPKVVLPPEDARLAIEEAMATSSPTKQLLAIVNLQRTVWIRAKEIWPTIQYQYRLFSELTHDMSHLLITVRAVSRSAPMDISSELDSHLKGLRRLAYQVRFVYHELHDLGVVSKEFYQALPEEWDEPGCKFSAEKLKQVVEKIREWSAHATKVVDYHQESRQKTWDYWKENLNKNPVPTSIWFRFGNPPAWEEFEEAVASLYPRGMGLSGIPGHLTGTTSRAMRVDAEASHLRSIDDIEIDELSPGEDDRRAARLLESANEQSGSPGANDSAAKGISAAGSTLDRKVISDSSPRPSHVHTTGPRPHKSGRQGPAKSLKGAKNQQGGTSGGLSIVIPEASGAAKTKRKSVPASPADPPEEKPATKRKKGVANSGAARTSTGGGDGNGAGHTTRAGRVIKKSERARNTG